MLTGFERRQIYGIMSIIDDKEFDEARKRLEARGKQLRKQGKGCEPNTAKALTYEEVNIQIFVLS